MNWVEIKYVQGRKSLHRGRIHERESWQSGRDRGKKRVKREIEEKDKRGIFVWKKDFQLYIPNSFGTIYEVTHKN